MKAGVEAWVVPLALLEGAHELVRPALHMLVDLGHEQAVQVHVLVGLVLDLHLKSTPPPKNKTRARTI